MKERLWALAGFLGLPSDWNAIPGCNLSPFDWQTIKWTTLREWGRSFNQIIENESKGTKNILIGYSLGGRLALHALFDNPLLWSGAILISTHPGLITQEEREARLKSDREWANRFFHEPWEWLMEQWNAQGVFKEGSFSPCRLERDYKREILCNALINGSLGRQEDLRKKISALPIPLLWITGALDTHYCQLAQALNFAHPLSRKTEVAGAGHRTLFAKECAPLIGQFQQSLNSF